MKAPQIRTPWPDAPQRWLATTSSTMDEAASLQRKGAPHGTLIVADHQTAGRGRNGRTWVSAPGKNLLFSVLLDRQVVAPSALLPLRVGATVSLAIDELVALHGSDGARPQVKWPNDVVMGGHKVAGVLCDLSGDRVIVGVGVTCNQRRGLPDGPYAARSLRQLLGVRVDRWALLESVLQHLYQTVAVAPDRGAASVSAIETLLYGMGMAVSIDEAPRGLPDRGVVEGLAADGALLVRDQHGQTHRYYSGRLLPAAAPSRISSRT